MLEYKSDDRPMVPARLAVAAVQVPVPAQRGGILLIRLFAAVTR
jgi:hypothetical protein